MYIVHKHCNENRLGNRAVETLALSNVLQTTHDTPLFARHLAVSPIVVEILQAVSPSSMLFVIDLVNNELILHTTGKIRCQIILKERIMNTPIRPIQC
jgi:hypothetical protein